MYTLGQCYGSWRKPNSCTNNCKYALEWCVEEEEATFKVTAATTGWIGIVFSPDLLMVTIAITHHVYSYLHVYYKLAMYNLITIRMYTAHHSYISWLMQLHTLACMYTYVRTYVHTHTHITRTHMHTHKYTHSEQNFNSYAFVDCLW